MDSPLGDDSDHEGDFSLTPRTEAKYNKIDEEFHLMMQRNQLNGVRVSSLHHSQVTLMLHSRQNYAALTVYNNVSAEIIFYSGKRINIVLRITLKLFLLNLSRLL